VVVVVAVVVMVVCGMDVVVLQSYGNGMWKIASLNYLLPNAKEPLIIIFSECT